MLYNRHSNSQRLNHFKITVGDNFNGEGNEYCVEDGGVVSGVHEIVKVCNRPLKGRYVHVKLVGRNEILTICEIQVYEKDGQYHFIFYRNNKPNPIDIALNYFRLFAIVIGRI